MAPVAFGVLAMIAGMAAISVMVGVFIGVVFWRVKYGLAWGILCIVVYMLVAPGLCDARLTLFARLNAAPMFMTFLCSYLIARFLHARNRSALWATLAALGCGLVVGVMYMFLFRVFLWVSLWYPVLIALVADGCLTMLAIRKRNAWWFDEAR